MAKSTKKPTSKKKVKIDTSFDELVNLSVAGNPKSKPKTKKNIKNNS